MAPAAATPGSARTRRSASSANARRAVVVGVARAGKRDRRRRHALGHEAGVDPQHAREAREQQAGAEQQHEGEGHLPDHQRAAQRACAPPPRRAAPFLRAARRSGSCRSALSERQQPEHGSRSRARARARRAPPCRRAGCPLPYGRSWKSKRRGGAQRRGAEREAAGGRDSRQQRRSPPRAAARAATDGAPSARRVAISLARTARAPAPGSRRSRSRSAARTARRPRAGRGSA